MSRVSARGRLLRAPRPWLYLRSRRRPPPPHAADFGNGLMYAQEPWSGYYTVNSPIWTSAQWTQFTEPGWRFLTVPSGGSGRLPGGGSYVTLVPPTGVGVTVILETLEGACLRCGGELPSPPTLYTFQLVGGQLPGPGTVLNVWSTNSTAYFVEQPGVTVRADGTFDVLLPTDAMVTVSTMQGFHGAHPTPPPSAPFPTTYADDFNSYAEDAMAHYWADAFGSWAVRGGALTQVVPANPFPNSWGHDTDPVTIIGGDFADVVVRVTGTLPPASEAPAGDNPAASLASCNASDPAQRWTFGTPAPEYLSNGVGAAQLCLNVDGCNSDLIYYTCVTSGGELSSVCTRTSLRPPNLPPVLLARRHVLRRRLLRRPPVRPERHRAAVAPAPGHVRLCGAGRLDDGPRRVQGGRPDSGLRVLPREWRALPGYQVPRRPAAAAAARHLHGRLHSDRIVQQRGTSSPRPRCAGGDVRPCAGPWGPDRTGLLPLGRQHGRVAPVRRRQLPRERGYRAVYADRPPRPRGHRGWVERLGVHRRLAALQRV